MADQYPETMELAIDRHALRRYLRTKWFLSWLSLLAFFGGMSGIASASNRLENQECGGVREVVAILVSNLGADIVFAAVFATLLYFLLSHRLAARMARGLRLTVEGPFFRIVQTGSARSDRKLHFRSIVDYTTVEGRLMRRFGLMALEMTTIGGGAQNTIRVIGLKDCERVRDLLADVDRVREQA